MFPHCQATVGIRLDTLSRPIGALRFQFFPGSGDVFKIETVVDAQCHETEAFSNASRTSDKRTLQNFDTRRLELGGRSYGFALVEAPQSDWASFR